METLKKIALKLASSLMTEKFVKTLVLFLLEKLSQSTKNKVDDEIVSIVKEALK